MKKKILIATAASLIVITIGLFFRLNEPSYDGKSITYWINQINDTENPATDRNSAINAIKQIGPGSVPWIIRQLKKRDGGAYEWIYLKSPKMVRKKLHNPTPLLGYMLPLLQSFGTNANKATPAVLDLLNSPTNSWKLVCRIPLYKHKGMRITSGQGSKWVTNGNFAAFYRQGPLLDQKLALDTLIKIAPDHPGTCQCVSNAIDRSTLFTKTEIFKSLVDWNMPIRADTMELMKKIMSSNPEEFIAVTCAKLIIKPPMTSADAQLFAADLNHSELGVRMSAALRLAGLPQFEEQSFQVFEESFQTKNFRLAFAAISKLEQMSDSEKSIELLLKALSQNQRWGSAISPILLQDKFGDRYHLLVGRYYATSNIYPERNKGLFLLRSMGKEGVPALIEVLKTRINDSRVCETLGAMGPLAMEAVPHLEKLSLDGKSDAATAAKKALAKIKKD